MSDLISRATLARQSYGLAMAQGRFGGPTGIWLECRSCDHSDVIVGSGRDEWRNVSTADAAKVFRRHGWSGRGPKMLSARCPACAKQEAAGQ